MKKTWKLFTTAALCLCLALCACNAKGKTGAGYSDELLYSCLGKQKAETLETLGITEEDIEPVGDTGYYVLKEKKEFLGEKMDLWLSFYQMEEGSPQYELNGQMGGFSYVLQYGAPTEEDWKKPEQLREKLLEKYGEPSTEEGRSDSFENFQEAIGKLPQQRAQRITGAEHWDFPEVKSDFVYKDYMQLRFSADASDFEGSGTYSLQIRMEFRTDVARLNNDPGEESLVHEAEKTDFTVAGLDYLAIDGLITEKAQMDYQLKIYGISVENGKLHLDAEIFSPDSSSVSVISRDGDIFESPSIGGKNTQRITVMMENKDTEDRILNCTFEKLANSDLLFPVNSHLSQQPVMTLAVMHQDQVLYFEDALPSGVYDKIKAASLTIDTLFAKGDLKASLSDERLREIETIEEMEEEVSASEFWYLFLNPVEESDVILLDDPETAAEHFGAS